MVDKIQACNVGKLQKHFDELKKSYVNFVTKNPAAVEQIEKSVKLTSYVVEALSQNQQTSIFISEFVSSACNLFAYANSRLLSKSKKVFDHAKDELMVEKIKQLVIVIDFSQAFLEIVAWRIGGWGAKWAIITIICLIKAILRCILIFFFQTGIQTNSILSMFKSSTQEKLDSASANATDNSGEVIYVGSRTGHKLKTLSAITPSASSLLPDFTLHPNAFLGLPPTQLTNAEKIGESLHALRPLLHVLASGVFGSNSYIPWLLAFIADSSSHVLLQRPPPPSTCTLSPYNANEKAELSRRYLNLAYYLLRSPIYNNHTEKKLLKLFSLLSKNVPLARYVFDPLGRYLPEWQKIYFYTWAD